MNEQDKQLLLKDLCARLPYGVKVNLVGKVFNLVSMDIYDEIGIEDYTVDLHPIYYARPYLRPMSSITEDEAREMFKTIYNHKVTVIDIEQDRIRYGCIKDGGYEHIVLFFNKIYSLEQMDWLNSNHFDYRGLIDKGLALEAPEDMYKNVPTSI